MGRLSAKREQEIRERSRQKRLEAVRCGPGSYPTDVDALLHEIKHLRAALTPNIEVTVTHPEE